MLISAQEAARRLAVKPATLYAYVSRGLVRSAAVPGTRERRYDGADIDRLRQVRRTGRRAGVPLRPFDPNSLVLDSALCLVEGGRFYYRGVDAVLLAERAGLEEVARLLWAADIETAFAASNQPGRIRKRLRALPPPSAPIERARAVLGQLAAEDLGALDVSPATVVRTGGRLVRALAVAVTGAPPAGRPIHQELARAWHLGRPGGELVRRCLVLVADHELNASTYVARCVASTGAPPYAVVLSALGALSGPRHGGATSRAEAMFGELLASRDSATMLAERVRRGEAQPGFGHPLYPDGDPRAAAILAAIDDCLPWRRAAPVARIAKEAQRLISRAPNVDFALAAATAALGLPRGAALGLFIIGRSVGWIAHALEQYATGQLIRPRARYIGPLPEGLDVLTPAAHARP